MCETPVLAFKQADNRAEIRQYISVGGKHACMELKEVMDLYRGRSIHINTPNVGKLYMSLPKHQRVEKS